MLERMLFILQLPALHCDNADCFGKWAALLLWHTSITIRIRKLTTFLLKESPYQKNTVHKEFCKIAVQSFDAFPVGVDILTMTLVQHHSYMVLRGNFFSTLIFWYKC